MATKKATKAATKTTKAAAPSQPADETPKKKKKVEPIAGGASHENKASAHHRPRHEEIAERAYFLWIERGRVHGSPEHDWLLAEAALLK